MEAMIGELIANEFHPALLNDKLIQHRGQEASVHNAVNRQLHIRLTTPTVARMLTTEITDLAVRKTYMTCVVLVGLKITCSRTYFLPCGAKSFLSPFTIV